MPSSRSVWSGYIRFGLVSFPVKAYTAASSGGGGIQLNQLHAECHSRIQYKKTCPQHGEIPSDQIVSGYQFAKDQYVVIDPDEIEKLRPKSEKDIAVMAFLTAIFAAVLWHGGRDGHHVAFDVLPAAHAGLFVRAPYHALHHVHPDNYLSSYTTLLDRLAGTGCQIKGRRVVLTGAS